MDTTNGNTTITHPIIADYQHYGGTDSERNTRNNNTPRSYDNNNNNNGSNNDTDTSSNAFLHWTTCDEVKRCSVAVISFIILAALVGSSLVLFWFLWAWFVLYLNLPGVLTPIVWLLGFIAPLCLFRIFSVFPKCIKFIFCSLCGSSQRRGNNRFGSDNNGIGNNTIDAPMINSWKTHLLFNERRKHVNAILNARRELAYEICIIISDYCFHSDILVTTKKNKLIGIYPDSALLHTVAEFTKDVTDLSVPEGNIHSVYVLVKREQEKLGNNCCTDDSSNELGNNEDDRERIPLIHQRQRRNDNIHRIETFWDRLPKWLWDPTEHVDMVICKYDLSQGKCVDKSVMFDFQQISNNAVQQLKGLYYRPNYRMLMDDKREKLVVMRDGEFIVFDVSNSINNRSIPNAIEESNISIESRRELLARPESHDDREQFLHLREYSWNAAIVIPPAVVRNIIRVVDRVEQTDSTILIDDSDVYVMIPFGDHALFVGNVTTGWLRYLDFSHVEPLSESIIHHISFSRDNLYIYLCCNNTLSLLSTMNFQPIVTVPFTDLDYTVPVGLVRTPPEEFQLQMMMNRHRAKLLEKQNKLIEKERMKRRLAIANEMNNISSNTSAAMANGEGGISGIDRDDEFRERLIENIQKESIAYQHELKKRLESISVIFASTRVFSDPRAFIYRFPINKCKVVTTQVNSRLGGGISFGGKSSKKHSSRHRRKIFDGTYLLDRNYNDNLGAIGAMTDQATGVAGNGRNGNGGNMGGNGNGFMDGTQGNAAGGGWHYISLKHRPWKMYNFGKKRNDAAIERNIKRTAENEYSVNMSNKELGNRKKRRKIERTRGNNNDDTIVTSDRKERDLIDTTDEVDGFDVNLEYNESDPLNGLDSNIDNDTNNNLGTMSIRKLGDNSTESNITQNGEIDEMMIDNDKVEEQLINVALEQEMELTVDSDSEDPQDILTTTTNTATTATTTAGELGAGDVGFNERYNEPNLNRIGI